MEDTPDFGSARAFSSPGMDDQLVCRPVATTRLSYPIFRPDAVVSEFVLGSKALTFSGMWARCDGMSESSFRRVSSFCFKPAPTSVLPRRSQDGQRMEA